MVTNKYINFLIAMHSANKQNEKYIASFLHLLPKPIYLHSRKEQVHCKCR